MGTGGWIFLAIVVGLAFWAMSIYNGLVALRNRFKNGFAQIDVQLKRRYDLIPNLVETAQTPSATMTASAIQPSMIPPRKR